jgi:hypothetical protein
VPAASVAEVTISRSNHPRNRVTNLAQRQYLLFFGITGSAWHARVTITVCLGCEDDLVLVWRREEAVRLRRETAAVVFIPHDHDGGGPNAEYPWGHHPHLAGPMPFLPGVQRILRSKARLLVVLAPQPTITFP